MKSILLSISFFLFSFISVSGQADPPVLRTNIIPPLPNAASLGKFGEVPVGLYSGTVQQNISIYDLKTSHVSLPVSVGYASNGVKVDEMNGKMGINWALNAGGVITRTVYNKPDEYGGGPFQQSPYNDWGPSSAHPFELYNWASYISQTDMEYDAFSFNFNGYSGSFILNKQGSQWVATALPYSNLKIICNTDASTFHLFLNTDWEFKIITPDGIEYYFGGHNAYETTTSVDGCTGSGSTYTGVPTAWYLTSIVNPHYPADAITLNYSKYSYDYIAAVNANMRLVDPNSSCYPRPAGLCKSPEDIFGGPARWNDGYETDCYTTTYAEAVNLTSITTPNSGRIIFTYSGLRTGVNGTMDSILQSIKIYGPNSPTDLIKTSTFSYYFSKGDQSYAPNTSTSSTNIDSRAFLTGIVTTGQSAAAGETYQFSYYDIDGLASRLSFSQDYYGYFNGQANTRFIPYGDYLQTNLSIPVADFTPDLTSTLKGVLKQVTYPTGGNSQFFYELHGATTGSFPPGGLRIQKIVTYDPVQNISSNKIFQYGSAISHDFPKYSTVETHRDNLYFLTNPENLCASTPSPSMIECNYHLYSSNSIIPLSGRGGYMTYYASVTEGLGNNFENGGIEHTFNTAPVNPLNLLQGAPIYNIAAPNYNYKWAQETNTKYFKVVSGTRIYNRTVLNTYTTDSRINQAFTQYVIKQEDFRGQVSSSNATLNNQYYLSAFDVISYTTQQEWDYLSSSVEKVFDINGNNPVTTTKNYYYDNVSNALPTRIEVTDSKGQTLTTLNKYPHDFSSLQPYTDMVTQNNINAVVEQTLSNTTLAKELSKTRLNYNYFLSNTIIEPAGIQRSFSGNTLITEATIDAYDANGNTLQVTGKDGIVTAYLYGYNKQYPVAKITGSTYAVASGYVNQTLLDNAATYTDAQVRTNLNGLRSIAGALVTTYTYRPPIGITSETDPNNKTSYYEYDELSRLALIRDKDNNIIKKICYNYAGQPEACPIGTSTVAQWRATGNSRCQACPANSSYLSNVKEKEEKDTNPASPTYGTTRWVVDTQEQCVVAAAWQQRPDLAYCELNSSGVQTGNLITPTYDINPCSSTYNQQGVPVITLSPGCQPTTCTTINCVEPEYKCIDGVCTHGTWSVIRSVRTLIRGGGEFWTCYWAWCFPDGTTSTYTETTTGATSCTITCY